MVPAEDFSKEKRAALISVYVTLECVTMLETLDIGCSIIFLANSRKRW